MNKLLSILLVFIFLSAQSQVVLNMKKVGGVYEVPCKVNGLNLSFIFDTGASDVSISLIEALFMIRHGYLKEENILGKVQYSIANGDIAEGTRILLKDVEIGGLKLTNVKASIVHELKAPLLLGQSAIQKLGKIMIEGNKLTIINAGNKINLLEGKIYDISEVLEPKYNYQERKYSNDGIYLIKSTMKPFTGRVKKTVNNIVVSEYGILNGRLNGDKKYRNSNGRLNFEGNYNNGKRDGIFKRWHENGLLESECLYENGKKINSYKEWWDNGNSKTEINYVNGLKNGLAKAWYENGRLNFEGNYNNGSPYGKFTIWNDSEITKWNAWVGHTKSFELVFKEKTIDINIWWTSSKMDDMTYEWKATINYEKFKNEKSFYQGTPSNKGIEYKEFIDAFLGIGPNGEDRDDILVSLIGSVVYDLKYIINKFGIGEAKGFDDNGKIKEIKYFNDSLIWHEKYTYVEWKTKQYTTLEKTYYGKRNNDNCCLRLDDIAIKNYVFYLIDENSVKRKRVERTHYPSGQVKKQIVYFKDGKIGKIEEYKENPKGLNYLTYKAREEEIGSAGSEILTHQSLYYLNGKIKRKVVFDPVKKIEDISFFEKDGNKIYEAKILYLDNHDESKGQIKLFEESLFNPSVSPEYSPLRINRHEKSEVAFLLQKTYDGNGNLIGNYGPQYEDYRWVFFNHISNYSQFNSFENDY